MASTSPAKTRTAVHIDQTVEIMEIFILNRTVCIFSLNSGTQKEKKKLNRVRYDDLNRILLRGSNQLPYPENPSNPNCAREGDFFTHRQKFAPTQGSNPDLWCAAGVLRPAGLASFDNS